MTTAAQAANNSNTPAVITVSSEIASKYTRDNFIKMDQYILHATEVNGVRMTGNMRIVYMMMMSYHRAGLPVILSSESIMRLCGLSSDKSARDLIKTMKAAGLIRDVKRGYRKANVYVPNDYVIETVTNTEGEDQNAASRPTRKSKPQLSVVENQEQPNDDHSGDAWDHVQHDVTDSEQPDVMPEPTETTEPQDEGETVDCILPTDDSDRNDSDAVKESEPDQLDQQIAAANLHGVQYDLAEIMRHCQGSRVKAAMRLQAEIGVAHRQRILEAQGAAQPQSEASNDDGYSIDDDWNPEDGDAY
ncbi:MULTISPECIES: hypothetical protein [Serratia]|uniref:hypothetical protein n=1 Tax=Serratia TaxID=613 RepID=UPI0018E8BABE|nr:hypothetical protein [Serratia ureilytica]MBJ2082582.1 hypothetical protein [Serratia ureilytica]